MATVKITVSKQVTITQEKQFTVEKRVTVDTGLSRQEWNALSAAEQNVIIERVRQSR